ncbi:hypothetical protein IWQ62_006053 [Dispira parvispora]|uniref:Uncharacterized protein n=1 Tax=Dispira parvispora TaxID=1520584 RepID=A0A9W8AL26_9FUNG|nr:hypothetical protein IWQ62_006053 [Dispira parvispora]
MKVSILGWGVLTYLLALSPGLLANEDPVCKELREAMTAEELQSPRGLIAKIVCPSLETESTPLNVNEVIEFINHDELLSLCSTELRQLGYLIYRKHHIAVREMKESYKRDRSTLYSKYHLSPEVQASSFPFTDERYDKLKTLPKALSPISPHDARRIHILRGSSFRYSIQHVVQPTTDLPEDAVKHQWIDLRKLSSKELLDFSPMIFLAHYNRPIEAVIFIRELYIRSTNNDFVVPVRDALGVVAETYPMYFVNGIFRSPFYVNLGNAISYIFKHNLYVYLLSTRNEEVIANLVNGLGTGYRLHNDIKALYMESLYLDNFDTELISRPARNLGREKALAISTEDLEHADFKSSAKKYQDICDRYGDMVADFLGPTKRYANVTFAGAKYQYF